MLSEVHYWMFGNALLLVLDLEALTIIGIHLASRRREFSFAKHGVSLAFFIYILGHAVFRVLYWSLWRAVDVRNVNQVVARLLWLFHTPELRMASLFDMVGLIMMVAVLTWNIRLMWLWLTLAAVAIALLSMYV